MAKKKLNKIKFDLNNINTHFNNIKEVEIGGKKVYVSAVIDFTAQQALIKSYLIRMFSKDFENPFSEYSNTNRLLAEHGLRADVVRICTNIDFDELPESILLSDAFLSPIIGCINNWKSFRFYLDETVKDTIRKMESDKSLGYVLDEVVKKLLEVYEDVDGQKLGEIATAIRNVGKQIEESNISSLMDEGSKVKGTNG